jgi:hypothetical protein
MTPLPATLRSLLVAGWSIAPNREVKAAPSYHLRVVGPAPSAGAERPVLVQKTVIPDPTWARNEKEPAAATLEVTLP